jgi:hypothetical protein
VWLTHTSDSGQRYWDAAEDRVGVGLLLAATPLPWAPQYYWLPVVRYLFLSQSPMGARKIAGDSNRVNFVSSLLKGKLYQRM